MTGGASEDGFTLVEVIVAAAVLVVLLIIVGNYLISASQSVAQSTAHQNDNAAAQRAVGLIDSNVRFACTMSISAGTLYVVNATSGCSNPGQPACAEWSSAGGALTEKTSSSGTSTVANGVSGLSFASNSAYNGLVTVRFNLRQPQDQAADSAGVSVDETLTAQNMSQAVPVGTVPSGCP
ncbi:MAG TPA: prepilin-type N-terminal cleavage/methylation domain-containing protein [Acidimicrobiales bacterium]|nr:prepilin-type N-terminal cleavage/methylation domain-containing protein [Acidimicrobiales bacterium]